MHGSMNIKFVTKCEFSVESQQSKICFLEEKNSNFKKKLSTRKTLFTNFVKESILVVYISNKLGPIMYRDGEENINKN